MKQQIKCSSSEIVTSQNAIVRHGIFDKKVCPMTSRLGARRNFCKGTSPKKAPHEERKAPQMVKNAPIRRKTPPKRKNTPPLIIFQGSLSGKSRRSPPPPSRHPWFWRHYDLFGLFQDFLVLHNLY